MRAPQIQCNEHYLLEEPPGESIRRPPYFVREPRNAGPGPEQLELGAPNRFSRMPGICHRMPEVVTHASFSYSRKFAEVRRDNRCWHGTDFARGGGRDHSHRGEMGSPGCSFPAFRPPTAFLRSQRRAPCRPTEVGNRGLLSVREEGYALLSSALHSGSWRKPGKCALELIQRVSLHVHDSADGIQSTSCHHTAMSVTHNVARTEFIYKQSHACMYIHAPIHHIHNMHSLHRTPDTHRAHTHTHTHTPHTPHTPHTSTHHMPTRQHNKQTPTHHMSRGL